MCLWGCFVGIRKVCTLVLIDFFPSTCNSTGGRADIPLLNQTWELPKAIFSLVLAVKPHVETLNLLKSFCFEPPGRPEPLPTDEDQWGWNHLWFRHCLSCSHCPGWNTKPSYHLYASRQVYPLYLLQYWLFPIPFIHAVVQCRRIVANTISIIILTRTE